MNRSDLISFTKDTFHATRGLIGKIPDDKIDWKPESGVPWMSVGQVLAHITATGVLMKNFVTGEWNMPAGAEGGDGDAMPSVESMPSVTKADALAALDADQAVMEETLNALSDEEYFGKEVNAPWGQSGKLCVMMTAMTAHHIEHKHQLFDYLKLMGIDVNTMDLYGMTPA